LLHLLLHLLIIRRDEIQAMAGQGPNVFGLFYERLREVKDYHRKIPSSNAENPEEHLIIDDEEALPPFTGEEQYGRCVDLHDFFETFTNLKVKLKSEKNKASFGLLGLFGSIL